MGSEFSHGVLVQAAKGWFLNAERDERQGNRLAFYDDKYKEIRVKPA